MALVSQISLLFSVATGGFLLSSVVGDGASTIIIPLLTLHLPVTQVPAALVTGTFASALTRTIAMRKHIRMDVVRWFVPAALPSVALGAWLLAYVDTLIVAWLTGLFLVANMVSMFSRDTVGRVSAAPHKPSLTSIVVAAVAGGLISGLTGAIGLLLNKFYFRSGLSKEEIVATRAANELLLHLVKVIFYAHIGLFTSEAIQSGLVIAAAAALSTVGVRLLLPLLNDSLFRRVGSGAMALSGAVLLVQATWQILEQRNPAITAESVPDGIESHILWNGRQITFELEEDGDITVERRLPRQQVPAGIRSFAKHIGASSHRMIVEECFGFRGRFYELRVLKGGRILKYELMGDGTPL